jgi:hypothetical protein
VRPIQLLVRLLHSHVDPNWLRGVERESRNRLRESEPAASTFLGATGSLPQVGLSVLIWMLASHNMLGELGAANPQTGDAISFRFCQSQHFADAAKLFEEPSVEG